MKKIIAAAALGAALTTTLFSVPVMAMSETPQTGYTETRYPIVLVHGFLGFDSVLGIEYKTQRMDGITVAFRDYLADERNHLACSTERLIHVP